jgi:hypothetical protein
MKWFLYSGIAIAIVLFLVAAIGAMLPVKHTASRTTQVAMPPEAVYRLVREIKYGDVPVRIEREEPPALMVTRVAGNNLPFGGTWTYRITPAPGGSELTITEDGEVYNVIFRFVSRFVMGHHATLDGYVRNLHTSLEGVKK